MRERFAEITTCVAADASVLIHGESWTGRELPARAPHGLSPCRDGPFEVIDCGALVGELAHAALFGHKRGALGLARNTFRTRMVRAGCRKGEPDLE